MVKKNSLNFYFDFYIGNVKCILMAVQPNNSASRRTEKYYEHRHPGFEFHYIVQGQTGYSLSGKEICVHSENILVIPPRMYHKETYSTQDNIKMSFTMEITEPTGAADVSDFNFYNAFPTDREIVIPASNPLLTLPLDEMRLLASSDDDGHLKREKMRAACHLFIVSLYEILSKHDAPTSYSLPDSPLSRENEIDNFLAFNFMSKPSKNDLADKLHVSTRQLHRIIKKSYGKNYREKLTETRLEIATSFLTSSEKRVCEIAEILGYSSTANFSSFIKKTTGKTPSEIRRESKEK